MSHNANRLLSFIALASLCSVVLCASAQTLNNETSFRVCSPVDLTDCPVALSLDSLPEFTHEQRKTLCVFVDGVEIPAQVDDLNGDSVPDEIAFLLSVERQKNYLLQIKSSDTLHCYPSEVWAEMYLKGTIGGDFREHTAEGKTYGIKPVKQQTFYPSDKSFRLMHHHGVAFESSYMAYRVYFDSRQTVDVYAKRRPRLELKQSLWYPDDSLLAEGYGDDILKVGNTIGVGSVRPYANGRLAKWEPFSSRTQRIVANGPVRTIVEVEVDGWKPISSIADSLSMRVRYTLFARHRDVFCEVFLSDTLASLVTGVQRIGSGNCKNIGECVASWGTDWPVNDTIKYPKQTVGLAVYVPQKYAYQHLSDERNTLISFRPLPYLRFWLTVVGLKEDEPPATNEEEFWHFVEEWKKIIDAEQRLLLPLHK